MTLGFEKDSRLIAAAGGSGFRPKSAAGAFILARQSGRFLFSLRAHDTASGGTWSLWGGKTEIGETPIQTALREVFEETGYAFEDTPLHLHRLEEYGFVYDTFLIVCDDEFGPIQCRESIGYAWLPIEDVPTPTHWGVTRLLEDQRAVSLLKKAVESESGRRCHLRPRIS
jgi:8-oxo-dGTP pyrophosphatase MutT (NUDIX family)